MKALARIYALAILSAFYRPQLVFARTGKRITGLWGVTYWVAAGFIDKLRE
jgi:hypothetical protein